MPTKPLKKEEQPTITNEEILDELNKIISNPSLLKSPVLTNFLCFIVNETLENHSNILKEYTIGVNALGKPEDFNPQIDAIVRIHAGRLRRVLNKYYLHDGKSDVIRIELIKGTYIPVFRIQKINDATKVIPTQNNPVQHSRSRLTLAVLPFRNLCPDNTFLFFIDGFGEELTRIFSTSQNIAVVAHHSTLKYANTLTDLRTIGSDLGVHYLITGSVRRTSKEIRVSVGLVETFKGTQVWSKNYIHTPHIDKDMEIQDQINYDVFSILSGLYGIIITDTMDTAFQKDKKLDLESFDAILWNYYAQRTHSLEDCKMAQISLEKCHKKNPNNVMCLTVLGSLYLDFYSLGYPNIEDPVNKAFELINKATKIAPQFQYAQVILGWVNIYLGKKEKALKAFDYSLELATPSASDKGTLGFGLVCAGKYNQGFSLLKQSVDFNPHCPWWYHMGFFCIHYKNGDYEKALSYTKKMNVSEDVVFLPLLKLAVMGQLEMFVEAKAEIDILNNKFNHIVSNLKNHLDSFLLDNNLVDNIIIGARKAGLTTIYNIA
ncbi:hypothetical protein [Formosa sp. PL04]|uniref:tetratricopeptide repeat protein n=1 Tax=Formosa sp. PL04 TaxID=3081755 RepID=UPI00298253B2|nr:hypothetical protein [Formosa sp. PL04]MDW5288938.1 hypothetical protein [Formosa sp. PL04]